MTAQSEGKESRDSDLRGRLATVREREFERAVRRLEASGTLSNAERRTVEELSRRVAARVVGEPAVAAETADASDDDVARRLVELFEASG